MGVRELFEQHADFVWRVLARAGVRDADLKDASQDPRRDRSPVKVRRWIFLVLVGCASPLTVAAPRDGEPALTPDAAPPAFGEAAAGDANDEPPSLSDPVEDAGIEAPSDAESDAEGGD